MMKKVNTIIQVIQNTYKLYADEVHDYFTNRFNQNIIITNRNALDYDNSVLNHFIDRCVFYRLGVSDALPSISDVIYDLSTTNTADDYETTTADIMRDIVYCAFPAKLTTKFQKLLEANDLPENVVSLIISKLEINQPEQ